jgi:hypothetical protein
LADWIEFAALCAFDLETRDASVAAKGSEGNRHSLAFVNDQEAITCDFVSDWSDGHLIGFSFEFSERRGLRRSLKRDSPNLRESPRKIVKNIFSRTHLFY